ncbi:MAG: DNA-directed RNA polymerase [archaeon]
MFYKLEVKGHVRVPPKLFSEKTEEAVMKSLTQHFDGFISKEIGVVIGVEGLQEVGEGVIIPGDGAAYYDAKFTVLTFRPELQDVTLGKITDIAEFGAFMNLGPIDGMIHISQTMDDFVSFNKSNVLSGKDTKHALKVGDLCRARIINVSYKDIANPKIGLTMRQHRLGSLNWIEEDLKKEAKSGNKKDE